MVFSRMDGRSRAAGIALVVLAFWAWWPIGLAALAYLAFGRRMMGWGNGPGAWSYANAPGAAPWAKRGGRGCGMNWGFGPQASGNHAFDDYRSETLRRLEEEQQEFQAYLERLRQARDKSEFDGFMAERRARQAPDTTV